MKITYKKRLSSLLLVGIMASGCDTQTRLDSHITPTAVLENVHQLSLSTARLFAQQTQQLQHQTQLLCQQYSQQQLTLTRQQWQQAMKTWVGLQGREKGSEAALALSWNIQFWPDKKNTTGYKLRQLIKQNKQWQSGELAQQSVAVQGLGAVEWFLYQQPQSLKNDNECQLTEAITAHLATTAQTLAQAWQHNPWHSLSNSLALAEYLAAINNQLDYTIKKLVKPMGKPGNVKPYQAEAWRSQTSLANLKASIESLQALYIANGTGLDALLREQGYQATAQRIKQRFTLLLADWPTSSSMVTLLNTKQGYRELINIFNGLEYIQLALHDDVAAQLGIVMGFNATDGD
ncbi:imelysin family protein [Photobacterium aquimaris]|uniref:Iron-regulated protein A n=1 Tax=Photobacterium aquimaris TaxID=512643 RepID=A0A2T3I281_9GAMM|nr:imelysin family protein [Photobacterium aquimaris]OBU26432.1 iron-regulated protein A [Photobacterium aquimaris]PQJ40820.1 iron-regulated protein A [Photobacterium aquimaris]PSU12184.1 iron-regulated protein A [Photobacterium aquimaris]